MFFTCKHLSIHRNLLYFYCHVTGCMAQTLKMPFYPRWLWITGPGKIDMRRSTYDGCKYEIKNGGFLVPEGGTAFCNVSITEEPSPWILMILLF